MMRRRTAMSEKNNDSHGRWRSKIVAFRVSPEEDELIEAAVSLSGLTKQDYIIRKLTDRTVTVIGNPRVYKALKKELEKVLSELVRIGDASEMPPDLLEEIELINRTMKGMREEC
jgi:uncharacterized protein (DUF1778 family)